PAPKLKKNGFPETYPPGLPPATLYAIAGLASGAVQPSAFALKVLLIWAVEIKLIKIKPINQRDRSIPLRGYLNIKVGKNFLKNSSFLWTVQRQLCPVAVYCLPEA